jgi:predicted PurR-regulated permease PerM
LTIIPLLGTWSVLLSVKFNIYREALWDFFNPMLNNFFQEAGPKIQEGVDIILRQGVQWLGSVAVYLLHNTWALGHVVLTLALSPVVAFYLVKDGASFRKNCYNLLPRPYRSVVGLCVRNMDRALRQYFSGQVRVCACLMLYYSVFLGLGLHFPYAIKMSIMTGLLGFIPYFGFFISLFTAAMIGIVESGQWPYVCSIALVYLVGNVLESLVLTPYLVGKRTGLHPLGVLLAVLIGGSIKGILGIVLALPVATVAASCWRLLRRSYVHSILYVKGFARL